MINLFIIYIKYKRKVNLINIYVLTNYIFY